MVFNKIYICLMALIMILLQFHQRSYAAEEGWHYLKSEDGVALYHAVTKVDGYLPFKAIATVEAPVEKIVMALVDAEHKSEWAPKLKRTKVYTTLAANQFEFSEYYTTPWPFWDREFLLVGQVDSTADKVIFSAKNSPNAQHASADHVLVDVAVLDFEISPLGANRSRVTFTFSGEFGGWIPPFVKTIIQEKWPVRFIQALQLRVQSGNVVETPRYRLLVNR